MSDRKDISRYLLHLGEDESPLGAVSPPIFQTSIFSYRSFDEFREAISDEAGHYLYTRGNNPTVNLLERKIAALEHGERAKLVSAGVAAISQSILAFLKSGDHVVAVRDSYSWTRKLLENYLPRFGVQHSYVEGSSVEEFERALRPSTKILFLESPTTFTFRLQDLRAVAELARSRGIRTIIDNSWATPCFQNPLDYGIDMVVHSCSKYLGGNSDLVAGVIVGRNDDIRHIFETEFQNIGTVPDPFMAWLILRGMRTLHIRMERHYQSAMRIVEYLKSSERVESVSYPLDPGHPQYDLARRQMRGGSGLLSFRLRTKKLDRVRAFTDALRYFRRAVSWGGYESLVMPYAVCHQKPSDDMISVVRLHVGLEDPELLIEDLERALGSLWD